MRRGPHLPYAVLRQDVGATRLHLESAPWEVGDAVMVEAGDLSRLSAFWSRVY